MEDEIIKTSATIAGAVAKPIIQKVVEKMTTRAAKIDQNISDTFQITGREMTVLCPESIQKYSISIISKKSSFFHNKARFELGKVRRANIRSLVGLESINAINTIDNGFEIDLKKLKSGERYNLDIEYSIEDPNFLDSLVNREVVNETPNDDSTEYWMVAQLKHLESLKSEYGRIDLRDVDFNVNVGVHQDVNTKIPDGFKDQVETLSQLTKKKGRAEKFKLFQKLMTIQNKPLAGKEFEVLGNIAELFSPVSFRKFVDVSKDFHYYNCEKGTNVYDYSFVSWPKFMKITSRTDLGLDKPAAKGTLIYKKSDFKSAIDHLFKK
ncbi:MAG: hypothetical protein RI100_07310 [Nitrosarchaeum sp.]|uniref:hypothetical protein n=1 Tax=Nitrosarchaeum sp. TaxID=2026886 RepID=UPI002DEABBA3|nr:hypothetical protein [Nitrosarchaeum sp.]